MDDRWFRLGDHGRCPASTNPNFRHETFLSLDVLVYLSPISGNRWMVLLLHDIRAVWARRQDSCIISEIVRVRFSHDEFVLSHWWRWVAVSFLV